jgi:hypothetical protein
MPDLSASNPRHFSSCFPHASPIWGNKPGKHYFARCSPAKCLANREKTGAGEGIRTLDPNLGKVVLYP